MAPKNIEPKMFPCDPAAFVIVLLLSSAMETWGLVFATAAAILAAGWYFIRSWSLLDGFSWFPSVVPLVLGSWCP